MPNITIHGTDGRRTVRQVPDGTLLLQVIGENHLETPCGGCGRCGKCRVTVQGQVSPPSEQERKLLGDEALQNGVRLACLAVAEGDVTVFLTDSKAVQAISSEGTMPEFALDPIFEKFGAVVDIGTTTLAARLYANDGTLLACAATPNPQRVYGADVISRIEKSLADEREALAKHLRRA